MNKKPNKAYYINRAAREAKDLGKKDIADGLYDLKSSYAQEMYQEGYLTVLGEDMYTETRKLSVLFHSLSSSDRSYICHIPFGVLKL